jgi:hypothetical protein
MQVACNCTTGMHPFDFDASSMEAQAHTSCNRRAGYYVRETALPLCNTSGVTMARAHLCTDDCDHMW